MYNSCKCFQIIHITSHYTLFYYRRKGRLNKKTLKSTPAKWRFKTFFELIPLYINLFSLRTGLFLKCWLVHGTVFTIRMKQIFRPQCANLLKQNAKIYAFFESKMRNCVKRFFHFVLNPFHYSVYLENINVDDFNNIYNLTIWSLAHQAMNVITT